MRRSRISLGMGMFLVVLAAINLAMLRAIFGPVREGEQVMGVILPINLLAIAGARAVRQVARRGECDAFLLGFCVAGSLATWLAWSIVISQGYFIPVYLERTMGWLFLFVQRNFATVPALAWPAYAVLLLAVVVQLSWPQILVAWLGGRLFRAYRIVVVCRHGQLHQQEFPFGPRPHA